MAFFTRTAFLTVPELTRDSILTEEPEELNLPATPPSPSISIDEVACAHSPDETKDSLVSISSTNNTDPIESTESTEQSEQSEQTEPKRFEYVVDRNYGVEVWNKNL